jgi:predicted secreted Zn-dependent protease
MRGLLKGFKKQMISITQTGPMKAVLISVAVLVLMACGDAAFAKPVERTKYTYYTISGVTAHEVYRAMQRRGPKVNGAKAYASTSATAVQNGKLLQGSSCRIVDYRIKLDFVIKLPRIGNEKILPTADRSHWRQFSAFLKQHEETHRRIWLGCAADVERQVKAIKTRSCQDASRRAAKLWEKMRASCGKKHEAFDAAEQKRLMTHPFVKLVFRRAAGD